MLSQPGLTLAVASLALLAACGASPPPRPSRPPASAPSNDGGAPSEADGGPEEAPPAPPPRSALERVREAVAGLEVVPGEVSSWLPSRLLGVIADASGEFPAPVPPEVRGDTVVWGLLAMGHEDASRLASVCDAVARAEPRVACATDTAEWSGAERHRVVLGWRGHPARVEPTLALPLRALSRFASGTCLVAAQHSLRTLDLTVRAPSQTELGRLLALTTTVPRLATLVLVRAEPRNGGLEALLSWPLDRAETDRADLADDPWPARCEGALSVGGDLPPRTMPTVRMPVTGARARGAVVAAAHREWLVTAGDRVGTVTVTAVDERGVTFTMGRRRVVAPFPRARPLP